MGRATAVRRSFFVFIEPKTATLWIAIEAQKCYNKLIWLIHNLKNWRACIT